MRKVATRLLIGAAILYFAIAAYGHYMARVPAPRPVATRPYWGRVVVSLDDCRAWADKVHPFAGYTDQDCVDAWSAAHPNAPTLEWVSEP